MTTVLQRWVVSRANSPLVQPLLNFRKASARERARQSFAVEFASNMPNRIFQRWSLPYRQNQAAVELGLTFFWA